MLVDQSTEELEESSFLKKIRSQPIPLEEFVAISFFDFAIMTQAEFHYGIDFNLREKESGETKNMEWELKHGLYT